MIDQIVANQGENRPNPNKAFPNPNIPSLCYIKNVVKNPRIIIGDYTYYDDVDFTSESLKEYNHYYINGFAQYGEQVMLIDTNYEDTINTILENN